MVEYEKILRRTCKRKASFNIYHIPTKVKEVHDVSGAGDTFIATLAYALDKGYDLVEAVKLANKASSIVVGKVGTATVSLEELFGGDVE